MKIGKRDFDFSKKVYVMGILNVTPDSFSDGGKFLDPERALDRALQIEEEGADLLDIGAESSRPGSETISSEEEKRRLLPVLKKLERKLRIPISVDTRKAAVAYAALGHGAALVNDISALRFDPEMASVIAKADVPCILMHMKGEPAFMQEAVSYNGDVVSEILSFLQTRIEWAVAQGIEKEKILVDPGIGFGKLGGHNLEILQRFSLFQRLNCPVVLGVSRKRFIRDFLRVSDPQDPLVQKISLVVGILAAWDGGAQLLRVHNVGETVQALKMTALLRPQASLEV